MNSLLWCTLAAACCCSLSTGWLIGIWGGITAMPAFAAQFFPQQTTTTSSSSSSHSSYYCMYNNQLLSLSGSVIYLAALPALAVAARATQEYGRKPTMWAIAVLILSGAVVGATAQNLVAVFLSRCLMGMAMGCSFQAPTMLLCEVLPRNSRGLGMYWYNIAMAAGFLLSGLCNMLLHGPAWGWRASVALLAAPGVGLVLLLPWVSESPQVLLQRGDEKAALQVLQRIRPASADITPELQQMQAAAARSASLASARQRLRALVQQYQPEVLTSVLYPLVLMLTGLNVLSTWTPNLLMALGGSSEFAVRSNTIVMAVGLAAALGGTFFVERVGRRTLLAGGGVAIVATMTILAVLLAVMTGDGSATAATSPALLPAALLLLCVNRVALTCTLQPLAAAVPAEVQPLQIRSDTSSLTTGIRNGSSFIVTQFALPVLCSARWGLFLIFAGCTAIGAVVLWLLVPETRGLPIEEVHLAWCSHWFWGRFAGIRDRALPVSAGCAAVAVAVSPASVGSSICEASCRGVVVLDDLKRSKDSVGSNVSCVVVGDEPPASESGQRAAGSQDDLH